MGRYEKESDFVLYAINTNRLIKPYLMEFYTFLKQRGYGSIENYFFSVNNFVKTKRIDSFQQFTIINIEDFANKYTHPKKIMNRLERFCEFLFVKKFITEKQLQSVLRRNTIQRISQLENQVRETRKTSPEIYISKGSKDYYKDTFNEFIRVKRREGLRDTTILNYCYKLRKFLDLKDSFLQFNKQEIDEFLSNFDEQIDRVKFFRTFAKYLSNEKIISKKQCKKIVELKYAKKHKHRKKKFAIPYDRWEELLSFFSDSMSRKFAVWLSIHYALRLGEIAHLKVSQFFLNADEPFFRIEPDDFRGWKPKTFSSERVIPISKNHVSLIKTYLQERKDYLEKTGKNHDYIIYSNYMRDRGNYISSGGIKLWFSDVYLEFLENGELTKRKISHHMLRYSGAYRIYEKSNNIIAVQKILGHYSPKQTMTYLELHRSHEFDVKSDAINTSY